VLPWSEPARLWSRRRHPEAGSSLSQDAVANALIDCGEEAEAGGGKVDVHTLLPSVWATPVSVGCYSLARVCLDRRSEVQRFVNPAAFIGIDPRSAAYP
jgi:hypothetical protein